MDPRLLVIFLLTLLLSAYTPPAKGLTVKQFADICHSSAMKCSDRPVVQAYIGGALDLVATLDEKTDYLAPLYCKDPKEIFDIPAITLFIQKQAEQHASDNAMLMLVRYFEKHGGCNHE